MRKSFQMVVVRELPKRWSEPPQAALCPRRRAHLLGHSGRRKHLQFSNLDDCQPKASYQLKMEDFSLKLKSPLPSITWSSGFEGCEFFVVIDTFAPHTWLRGLTNCVWLSSI